MGTQQQTFQSLSQELLLSVAEELKLPLLQIARLAEQAKLANSNDANLLIESTADSALKLIDSYILGVRLSLNPLDFCVENVSVSSVLYDTKQELTSYAKNYGVDLELNIAGKYGPVSANKKGLESALVSLGAALIQALPAMGTCQLKLQLATHRSRYGIVAGVYADTKEISLNALNAGRKLAGVSRQPLLNLSHSSGAGVFVADSILKAMNLNLTVSRHDKWYGIATILPPSRQIQLVT
ncbi:MAG TPA: hypothetical protein VFN31_01885 [Candidatus Saccharimonadales bacterium]|nr:hypothetical protein [Candidatus Saccharimonadales bacterium]